MSTILITCIQDRFTIILMMLATHEVGEERQYGEILGGLEKSLVFVGILHSVLHIQLNVLKRIDQVILSLVVAPSTSYHNNKHLEPLALCNTTLFAVLMQCKENIGSYNVGTNSIC